MLCYEKLVKRPLLFHRMTGLTTEEFDALFDKFQSSWRMFVAKQFLSKERRRAYGGGRHTRLLSLEDKLLFILVYARHYPIMVVQGLFFDFEDSRACAWVHRLLPQLDQAMGFAHLRPRRGNGRSLEEILKECPELREFGFGLDGTERPTHRPKDKVKQKEEYSGKKKRHTKKNILLISLFNCLVLFLGKTQGGSVHDKTCTDEDNLRCNDPTIQVCTDLGLLGLKIGNATIVMPKKKPRGKELTDSDKEQNRAISSIRVRSEHANAGIKRNRSVADVCRNRKQDFSDLLMSVACGLHNLRVVHRQGF